MTRTQSKGRHAFVALIFSGLLTGTVHSQEVFTRLNNPVEIDIPATGVPTIQAQSEADAAFAIGYMHARDRLFQMDYTRRLADGTVSELLGPAALSTDIQLRTLGFKRSADKSLRAFSDETTVILQGYADGVNSWLKNNPLPPEYAGLEISQVRPWLPIDSVAVAKLVAFNLSNDLDEIDNTIALSTFQQVGEQAGFNGTALYFEDLYRAAPPDDRVSVPGFLGISSNKKTDDIAAAAESQDGSDIAAFDYDAADLALAHNIANVWNSEPILSALKGGPDSDKGSNVWAIAADRSDTGYPLIANDPHLSLDYPSTFYPLHVNVVAGGEETLNVSGVGFPGAPVVAQGCNTTLCWGSTVHPIDETDFYFETIQTNLFGLPSHTVYKGQAEPIVWIFQSYFANQIGDGIDDNIKRQNVGYDAGGITFIVPRRIDGPILSLDLANKRAVSMQYTGFAATKEIEAFFEMAKAADLEAFEVALTKFDFGSQNFGVADVFGNIAYLTGGEIPVREDLQTLNAPDGVPPMFIRDGTGNSLNEWMMTTNPQLNQSTPFEIIPVDEMPNLINPASGYIANANNDPVGVSLDNNVLNQLRPGGGLYYISQGMYSSYRQGRLDRLAQAALADGGTVGVAEMQAWQANNQLMDAELIMPYVMQALNRAAADDAWPGIAQFLADPRLGPVSELFANWDYSTPTGLAEGYDPGGNPFAAQEPDSASIGHSAAATIYSLWRSLAIGNTIDATIEGLDAAIGQDVIGPNRPGNRDSFNAFKNLLDAFPQQKGIGVSGINFFTNPEAPTPEDARDFVILGSLKQALDLLASDEFAPAFNNSTNPTDYRWGKLHRIVFSHPLGDALSVPNGLFGLRTVPGLEGVARAGGYQVLDASTHSVRAKTLDGFMFGSGPARRFFASMNPSGVQASQIIPGGQSGVITSGQQYVNQLVFWLVNAYQTLFIDAEFVRTISDEKILLSPAGN